MKWILKGIALALVTTLAFVIVTKIVEYNSLVSKNTRNLELILSKNSPSGLDATNGDVKDLISFDYDTMFIFEPYQTVDEMEKQIGFKYSKLKQGLSEGITNILFVKDNKVAAYLFGYPSNTGYFIEMPYGEYEQPQINTMIYIMEERHVGNSYGPPKTYINYNLIDIVYIEKQYEKNRIVTPWGEKIKSGNLSVDYTPEQAAIDIEALALNTVNVPIQIYIRSLTADTAIINEESKNKAIKLIKKLRYQGINVILEPYPYIKNGELYETQLNPEDKNEWFRNWKEGVLNPLIQDIAKPYKVYALCIGSNFDKFENEHDLWRDTANFVRRSYKGRITYKTNWWYTAEWDTEKSGPHDTYTAKLNNPILEEVDFISVAAYFELTDQEKNSLDDLVSSIYSTQIFERHQNIFKELKSLSSKWNKPVFFGELGFPKRNKALAHPWNPEPSTIFNEEEQANGFRAYKEVFEKESCNLGFSVFAIGKKDEFKNYYPTNQSINVINSWYK
jgi:hypothetical protein